MSRIVITGCAGFLGSEIVRQALRAGHDVVGLLRPGEPTTRLRGIDLTLVEGDVTRPATLTEAFAGADYCIHTAGNTSFYRNDRRLLFDVNVRGVANVIEAAQRAGVSRMVHTSSVAAVGYDPAGHPVDEETEWNWPGGLVYMETKRDGERIALEAASDTFEVVALNPATIYGPGELNANDQQLIRELREGRVPLIPPGGMTLCDVEDVAAAHLCALERGRSGERYILGGPHATHREILTAFAEFFGVRPPRRSAPSWVLAGLGGLLYLLERLGMRTRAPAGAIRLSRFLLYYSSSRAMAQLGYRARSLTEIIQRTGAHTLASHPAPR